MSTPTIHEAYSFVCLRCGHGWEGEYDIAHAPDIEGHMHAVYYTHGQRVDSPLAHPCCDFCDSKNVRILRSGATRPRW